MTKSVEYLPQLRTSFDNYGTSPNKNGQTEYHAMGGKMPLPDS
jgi:hypothetical protein